MERSIERPAERALGGYRFLSRFKSHVEAEVYLAACSSEDVASQRVLILHAARKRIDFRKLEADLYDQARAQPAVTHPSVSSVVDFFESDEGLSLVLEHVVGSDLFTLNAFLASKSSALSCELTAHVALELLKGLHHVHTCPRADGGRIGMVVSRLAPERVRLSNDGEVKLASESLAKVLARPEHTEHGPERCGYLPVEWIAGEPETPASNVYTAGVMMFELLLGRPCFVGKTAEDVLHQVATRGVRTQELSANGVPAPLAAIVERATRHVPEQRYSSASEMSVTLTDWLASRGGGDMKAALARFLAAHKLAATRDLPEEVTTADIPTTLEVPEKPASDAEASEPDFGLRKPARRTVTKVGLRK